MADTAKRALRGAVRAATDEPGEMNVHVLDDRVVLRFERVCNVLEMSPVHARELAAALSEAADRAEKA